MGHRTLPRHRPGRKQPQEEAGGQDQGLISGIQVSWGLTERGARAGPWR